MRARRPLWRNIVTYILHVQGVPKNLQLETRITCEIFTEMRLLFWNLCNKDISFHHLTFREIGHATTSITKIWILSNFWRFSAFIFVELIIKAYPPYLKCWNLYSTFLKPSYFKQLSSSCIYKSSSGITARTLNNWSLTGFQEQKMLDSFCGAPKATGIQIFNADSEPNTGNMRQVWLLIDLKSNIIV